MRVSTVAKELEVKPGETVDLGTIDIASEERPEPMRSGGEPRKMHAARADGWRASDAAEVRRQRRHAGGQARADADLYLVFHIPRADGAACADVEAHRPDRRQGDFRRTVNPHDFGVGVRPRSRGVIAGRR